MKKYLTHILVVLINFYLMAYIVGIILMILTSVMGPFTPSIGLISILSTGIITILYQRFRNRFFWQSIGEKLIQNHSKEDILKQTKFFSISRVPLFILLLITLAINGNILDGLSEGKTFAIGTIIIFIITTSTIFYGIKNFIRKPELSPIFIIIFGLMLVGLAFKYSPKAPQTGGIMFNVYLTLSFLWLAAGTTYKYNKVKTTNI